MLSLTCSKVIIHRSSRCRAYIRSKPSRSPALACGASLFVEYGMVFLWLCLLTHTRSRIVERSLQQPGLRQLGLSDTQWSRYSRGPTCQDEGTTEPGCLVGELLKFYSDVRRGVGHSCEGWARRFGALAAVRFDNDR